MRYNAKTGCVDHTISVYAVGIPMRHKKYPAGSTKYAMNSYGPTGLGDEETVRGRDFEAMSVLMKNSFSQI